VKLKLKLLGFKGLHIDHRCNGPMAWPRSFPFTLDGDRAEKKSWNGLKP